MENSPPSTSPIARFSTPCRVWAIGAVRGEAAKLGELHDQLAPELRPGDKLVYLGNVIGRGETVRETVDEILRFRREFLSIPGNCIGDYAILRGRQEEMLHKLLELQFAVNPRDVLRWMVDQGVGPTIAAYGGNAHDGEVACAQGAVAVTRWTQSLRTGLNAAPGHREFLSSLKHAAYTADGALVFVHAGLDPERPLDAQGDGLWWNTAGFEGMTAPFFGTERVIRGLDPEHSGVVETEFTLSLDGGCGFGGDLIAAGISPNKSHLEFLTI
ncbi:MAG: serine/threonine protein phosphatase 1 [Paracoccaceae bacterium]|jgi:serine/threonine protein phosphatase 1